MVWVFTNLAYRVVRFGLGSSRFGPKIGVGIETNGMGIHQFGLSSGSVRGSFREYNDLQTAKISLEQIMCATGTGPIWDAVRLR